MAGMVSDCEMSSSIREEQSTADLAPAAPFPTTTELRKVLIPPDLEMDFAFTAEVVFFPLWTTFIPVSRFWPSPANVMPVYSILDPSP